jgi:type II secretory pathway component PulF
MKKFLFYPLIFFFFSFSIFIIFEIYVLIKKKRSLDFPATTKVALVEFLVGKQHMRA